MKRIFLFLLTALITLASFAQDNSQRIISQINDAAAKLNTMQCNFTQTKTVNGVDFSLTIDLTKWAQNTTPDQIKVIADLFWGCYPKMYNRFASVAGTVKDTPTEWVATLVPQSKELKHMFTSIILHFNKEKSVVVKVEMLEKNGDTTVIVLNDIIKNKKIDAKTFSVN